MKSMRWGCVRTPCSSSRATTGRKREGFVYYIQQELRAAKWRDWKMHMVWEPEPNAGPNHLETAGKIVQRLEFVTTGLHFLPQIIAIGSTRPGSRR